MLGARGYYLHILGYHEGALSEEGDWRRVGKGQEIFRRIEKLLKKRS
jgi:hypothetical protein